MCGDGLTLLCYVDGKDTLPESVSELFIFQPAAAATVLVEKQNIYRVSLAQMLAAPSREKSWHKESVHNSITKSILLYYKNKTTKEIA